MIDPDLAALRDEYIAAVLPRHRPTDRISEVRGGTRAEAAALIGCDVDDVHEELGEARARIQAWEDAHA
jgi:DNA-directed RNA polymerase specialized sigma24 family protein